MTDFSDDQRSAQLQQRLQQTTAQAQAQVWQVSALCRAVADALQTRFGTVHVAGEISSWTRAASGHCYFTLKDAQSQLRCVMFAPKVAQLLWQPQVGDKVEVQGQLSVYHQRGELQMTAEAMHLAGQGSLHEQYLRLKESLSRQGLFDEARKRPLNPFPKGVGVVTSPNAAVWHDVQTTLARRAPHVPIVLSPASVQGVAAPQELVQALLRLYQHAQSPQPGVPPIDTILLVRGGGSIEDLWAFNDEQLAHTIVRSPVPLISGVGHHTDFTIADFCADVRAPTPTAAAEMCAMSREEAWKQVTSRIKSLRQLCKYELQSQAQYVDDISYRLQKQVYQVHAQQTQLHGWQSRLDKAMVQARSRYAPHLQQLQARLDHVLTRQLSLGGQRERLQHDQHRLDVSFKQTVSQQHDKLALLQNRLQQAWQQQYQNYSHQLAVAQRSLQLLSPMQPLQRGYALLQDAGSGQVLRQVCDFSEQQSVLARVADGTVSLQVKSSTPNKTV